MQPEKPITERAMVTQTLQALNFEQAHIEVVHNVLDKQEDVDSPLSKPLSDSSAKLEDGKVSFDGSMSNGARTTLRLIRKLVASADTGYGSEERKREVFIIDKLIDELTKASDTDEGRIDMYTVVRYLDDAPGLTFRSFLKIAVQHTMYPDVPTRQVARYNMDEVTMSLQDEKQRKRHKEFLIALVRASNADDPTEIVSAWNVEKLWTYPAEEQSSHVMYLTHVEMLKRLINGQTKISPNIPASVRFLYRAYETIDHEELDDTVVQNDGSQIPEKAQTVEIQTAIVENNVVGAVVILNALYGADAHLPEGYDRAEHAIKQLKLMGINPHDVLQNQKLEPILKTLIEKSLIQGV